MSRGDTGTILKYAIGSSGPINGARQRFVVRRGQRSIIGKIFVVAWAMMNILMFFITLSYISMLNSLSQQLMGQNHLLLWLVLNVTGFIIIHYTSGPSIIEELPFDEGEGRGAAGSVRTVVKTGPIQRRHIFPPPR